MDSHILPILPNQLQSLEKLYPPCSHTWIDTVSRENECTLIIQNFSGIFRVQLQLYDSTPTQLEVTYLKFFVCQQDAEDLAKIDRILIAGMTKEQLVSSAKHFPVQRRDYAVIGQKFFESTTDTTILVAHEDILAVLELLSKDDWLRLRDILTFCKSKAEENVKQFGIEEFNSLHG